MYSPLYSDYIPMFIFYSRFKLIGKSLCQICETNVNTQFKLLHMFDYHGIFICNNNRCIVSAQETIDDIFTEHPIYNLNLNRNDIKYPNDNIILSSIKPENSKLNLNQESKKNKVFVHIRLGDASSKNPGIKYYEMCLDKLKFDSGYISTDSIDEKMIHKLCEKYNLSLYENTPGNTILFAKNFDNLVLSGGTFSWWIGFLSQASNILYPKNYLNWHGDIFVNNNWNGISC